MTIDPYTDRLARVRQRFVSTLEGKIDSAYAALPSLAGAVSTAPPAVADAYRAMHGIVGISPTVGFPATGRAAHAVEDVLRRPQQAKRGLTDEEILAVKKCLHALREAAKREIQSFYSM
jgi:chemotaxis protein histidine kinase CheA